MFSDIRTFHAARSTMLKQDGTCVRYPLLSCSLCVAFAALLSCLFFPAIRVVVATKFGLGQRYTCMQTPIDWCCFYYFVRNSLVALLEALCARSASVLVQVLVNGSSSHISHLTRYLVGMLARYSLAPTCFFSAHTQNVIPGWEPTWNPKTARYDPDCMVQMRERDTCLNL